MANVPNFPGVPGLSSYSGISNVTLLAADAGIVVQAFSGPQWGLFNAAGSQAFGFGSNVPGLGGAILNVVASALTGASISVGGVEVNSDFQVATAPQEQGAFVSSNKVQMPYVGRIMYIVGGPVALRSAVLTNIIAAQKSTQTFSLVMPEYQYPTCTIIHHSVRRTAQHSQSLLMVEIWAQEIRFTAQAAFTNTATPSGQATQNSGTVSPQTPTSAQSAAVPVGGPN